MAEVKLVGGPIQVYVSDDNMSADRVADIANIEFEILFKKFADVIEEGAAMLSGDDVDGGMFG